MNRELLEVLKKELDVDNVVPYDKGLPSGGCISEAMRYSTSKGDIFLKTFKGDQGSTMYEGELESLKAIVNTNTVQVPKPFKVIKLPEEGKYAFAMEYLNFSSLSSYQEKLGEQMARLHLHNVQQLEEEKKNEGFVYKGDDGCKGVERFGFHVQTCCGVIPLDNEFQDDWVTFYARQRLQHQVNLLMQKNSCRQVIELWSELQLKLDKFFKDIDILPSLLHGDLWGGNVGETKDYPVIFDPASYYGHHEFELAIAMMFGGIGPKFLKGYHSLIPKDKRFKERHSLYKLFHYLNHWNHFGESYRGQSISTLKDLLRYTSQ